MDLTNDASIYYEMAHRLLENARDLIYRLRIYPELAFEYVSPSSTRITGYTPQEHYADPRLGFKLVHPDDLALLGNIASGELALEPVTIRWITKTGEIIWTEQQNTPVYKDGRLVAIEGVARDITYRKKIEEEFLLLKEALDHSGNAIFLTTGDGTRILFANKAFKDWFKFETFTLNQCGGAPELFISRKEALQVYRKVGKGSSWGGEVLMKSAQAEPIPVFLKADAVYTPQGSLVGLFGVCIDLSVMKQKEDALIESERRMFEIIQCLPDATLVIDAQGKVIAWNRAIEEMTGIESDNMIGQGDYEYAIPFYGERRPILIDHVLSRLPDFEDHYLVLKKDSTVLVGEAEVPSVRGKNLVLRATASVLFDANGNRSGAIESIRDVTELRRTQLDLLETRQLLADMMDFLPDVLIAVNLKGEVVAWNKSAEKLTGIKACDMIGKGNYEYTLPFLGERLPMLVDLVLKPKLQKSSLGSGEVYCEGNTFFSELYSPLLGRHFTIAASPLYNSKEELSGAIQSLRDNTQQKKAEQEIVFMSRYDGLTKLYNRSFFESVVHRRNASNDGNSVGIVICDVDGLKLVNDTLGHEAGDRMLVRAAQLIKENFRQDDIISRIGGDEFAVLLVEKDARRVEEMVARLKLRLEEYNRTSAEIPLSISTGYSWGKEELQTLIRQADNNMYREKLSHKNSAKGSIIQALIKTQDARDKTTGSHAERIRDLTYRLAKTIGYPGEKMNDLILFTQFHDIGKVGVPDHILLKPGPLDDNERLEMQRHCEIGFNIAISSSDMRPIAAWILHHHEWWNGSGYPRGMAGEAIPLECRILAVVDAYDAMTSERPYRQPFTHDMAMFELKRCAGTQFDERMVDAFCTLKGF